METKSEYASTQSGSFLTLLLCLLGLIIAAPFADRYHLPIIQDVVFSIVFFAGIWSLYHNRRVLYVGLILILPALTARYIHLYVPREELLLVSSASTALFMLFNAYALLLYILRQHQPHPDTVYGGICIYLFLGFLWAEIYVILELLSPGAFSLSADITSITTLKGELSYFSFVTLATLGYGEITPVSDPARTLAIMEAVVGQMFVAIFIARLVGFHLAPVKKS